MNRLPRRAFDRSILLARCRWECMRRTAEYRTRTAEVIREAAESFRWTEDRFERYCLENGGVLEPASRPGGRDHYHELCRHYGLVALIHPDVAFSEAEMAAFPIFADTPPQQPKVKDRRALQRFARRGGDLSQRTRSRMFAQAPVHPGPFQVKLKKRVHLSQFDKTLAVFDARCTGKPFKEIANAFGLSLHQAKRAWETARRLIPKWLDLESHLEGCSTCQAHLSGHRDHLCVAAELQIGLPPTGVSRFRPSPERLDILAARQEGLLPARRSSKRIDSTSTS